MRKNIYTLVRLTSDRNTADTYVSRSFEKLDNKTLEVIKGCISEDMEESFESNDKPTFDECFLNENLDSLMSDNDESYTEDFGREGLPVWEYNDEITCVTYLIHTSICECADVTGATIANTDDKDVLDEFRKKAIDKLKYFVSTYGESAIRELINDTGSSPIIRNGSDDYDTYTLDSIEKNDDGTISLDGSSCDDNINLDESSVPADVLDAVAQWLEYYEDGLAEIRLNELCEDCIDKNIDEVETLLSPQIKVQCNDGYGDKDENVRYRNYSVSIGHDQDADVTFCFDKASKTIKSFELSLE